MPLPGVIIMGQFENPANPKAHYETTGSEIWADTDGKVDVFIAGVGTGGTVSGAGKYLKEKNPAIRVIAVEPDALPLLSGGVAGSHAIQSIGANFVPAALNTGIYDEIIRVANDDAFDFGRQFARTEGVLIGISSGAAPGIPGQDHRCHPARFGRPLPVHAAVRR